MTASDAAAWGGFSLGMLGASAALLGLIFVAVSINLEQLLRYPWVIGRAGDAMLELLTVFVASAFVLIPQQPMAALGLELILAGVASMGLVVALAVRRRPMVSANFRRPTDVATLLSSVAIAPIAICGLSLLAGGAGGLYWLVPGSLACVGMALLDSWVLLVEIKR